MANQFELNIYDPNYNQIDQVINPPFALSLVVNGRGSLTVPLPRKYNSLIREDCILELWHAVGPSDAILQGNTIFLVRKTTKRRNSIQVTCHSALSLCERRIVAFAAGSPQAQKTAKSDDMIKAIARENLGPLTGDAARTISMVSIAADLGLGQTMSKGFSRKNVQKVMQEIASESATKGTRIYFDVVYLTSGALEFKTWVNNRGTDRTWSGNSGGYLMISEEAGNLANAELTEDYTDARNYIYAGGQGAEDTRAIQTSPDPVRIGASPFGRFEDWLDARNASDATSLKGEADARLREAMPKVTFTGDLVETPQCRYDIDYGLADLVTAEYDGKSYDCLVSNIDLSSTGEKEPKARTKLVYIGS